MSYYRKIGERYRKNGNCSSGRLTAQTGINQFSNFALIEKMETKSTKESDITLSKLNSSVFKLCFFPNTHFSNLSYSSSHRRLIAIVSPINPSPPSVFLPLTLFGNSSFSLSRSLFFDFWIWRAMTLLFRFSISLLLFYTYLLDMIKIGCESSQVCIFLLCF